ncbi:MAG: AraC family transcriptional regulator [Muricomes sp.]|nr:AraC family transcriptional regulator [Muricomes sp.]
MLNSDTKYFIKRFRKIVGVTPKEFRKIYRIKG